MPCADGTAQPGDLAAREALHQRALEAAIAAYQDMLRIGDPDEKACLTALRAYQEICPDDTHLSDQVVTAVILATEGLASKS
ncbi:MAG: hypothetical protein ACR2Q4_01945 [Geminicoccaceae bacterium]